MTAKTLTTLRSEHREMQKLLDLLGQQLQLMEEGRRPDFELLTGIIDYFRSYPDLYHHSKEDLVAQEVLARNQELGDCVKRLEREHEQCAAKLGALSRALLAMLMEPQDRQRELFQSVAHDFMQSERAHIAWEDAEFFAHAERELGEEDWRRIDNKVARLVLPGFEKEAHARLAAMHALAQDWRGQ